MLGVLALSESSFAQDFTVRRTSDDSEAYAGTLTDYATTLLTAATTSYEYLRANPDNATYNRSQIPTGTYEKADASDRFWAAAEYFDATGDLDALADFESKIPNGSSFAPNFD